MDSRLLCFYLPQYHPTPYNDEWWGKGFTEWTNVVKARPRFRGHYQPHLPADLGFYDLRLPQTREAQAEMAREYGIHGFCYYHYWFSGKRLLEQPLDGVIASGRPDFPFCICWANENWTRSWDGLSRQVLITQQYSAEDDLAHIRQLLPLLGDRRYIRAEGKPLVLVYRVELLPDPKRMAEIWRGEAARMGFGDLFLVNVQGPQALHATNPESVGFDAALRFQPHIVGLSAPNPIAAAWRVLKSPRCNDRVIPYQHVYRLWKESPAPDYRHFHCVTPMWDNSPRRATKAWMIRDANPELYERWLTEAVQRTIPDRDGRRWTFINAWNEWGEGCHLEPCQRWGRAYLEATRRVARCRGLVRGHRSDESGEVIVPEQHDVLAVRRSIV
jgi:lipopolysaccharide biosynthesis protein